MKWSSPTPWSHPPGTLEDPQGWSLALPCIRAQGRGHHSLAAPPNLNVGWREAWTEDDGRWDQPDWSTEGPLAAQSCPLWDPLCALPTLQCWQGWKKGHFKPLLCPATRAQPRGLKLNLEQPHSGDWACLCLVQIPPPTPPRHFPLKHLHCWGMGRGTQEGLGVQWRRRGHRSG